MTGRRRRIAISYLTTGFTKSAAAAVQLLALPVVASTLGSERFGALLVLAAIGSFFCMPAHGLPSSVSFGIARARALGDERRLSAEIWSAGLLSGALGAVAVAVALAAFLFLDPTLLVGRGSAAFAAEARMGIAALALFVAATYFFSWVEGLRSGFEEVHVTNLFTMAGSVAALAGIGLAWAFAPTIPAFLVATYAVYPLVQGLNLLLFAARRRILLRRQRGIRHALGGTARRAFGYSVAQTGLILHLQGSVYIAAHAFGLGAGALIGGVVRLFYIVHNLLLSLLNPILPTLSFAATASDSLWIRRAVRRAAALILLALGLFAAGFALGGDRLVEAWLRLPVAADLPLFAALAAMAFLYIASQLFYLMLLALGDGEWASRRLFWGGAVGTLAGLAALDAAGLVGLVAGQALGMLVIAFVPISLRLLRRASAGSSDAEAVAGAVED